jgi:hypothetical protein
VPLPVVSRCSKNCLLDDLVGPLLKMQWNIQTEGFCSLEVGHEFNFRWELDWHPRAKKGIEASVGMPLPFPLFHSPASRSAHHPTRCMAFGVWTWQHTTLRHTESVGEVIDASCPQTNEVPA